MSFNLNTFNGEYIGIVLDNNDESKSGKLKVTIPSLTNGFDTVDIPWAEPAFPYAYNDRGILFIPEVNSAVKIYFLNGSIYKPVWASCIPHESTGNYMPKEMLTNYPNRKIIKTKTAYILYDDTDEFIEVRHLSGTDFIINKDGSINVKCVSNVTYDVDGDMDINCKGNYKVVAKRIDLN